MIALAMSYRGNADRERVAASEEVLSNRREMHQRAAVVWDEMASSLENTERLAIRNAAAKAARRSGEYAETLLQSGNA